MKLLIVIVLTAMILTSCQSQSNGEEAPSQEASPSPSYSPSSVPSSPSTVTPDNNLLDVSKLTNTFGFASEEGTHLIIVDQQEETSEENIKPQQLNQAIGMNGSIVKIKHVKHQAKSNGDDGRHTANNFNNLEGELFEVIGPAAVPDASYYLMDETKFNTHSLLSIQPVEPQEPAASITDEILVARNRTIEHSWLLATMDAGQDIFLVQFERQGDQMLASLVMRDGDKWTYMDYPAAYDASSTWRVDDQGEISPGMFSFLFAAQSDSGIVLAVKWMGAEGENITVLKQSGDRFTEMDISASRYMSPI